MDVDAKVGVTPITRAIIEEKTKVRSNSIHIDKEGVSNDITLANKNYVSGNYNDAKWQDAMKIAVFSQEGIRKFSKKFHKKAKHPQYMLGVNEDNKDNPYNEIEPGYKKNLLDKIDINGIKYKTQPEVLNALFAGKDKPTVIAIIEGNEEELQPVVKIETDDWEDTYLLADTGINAKGVNQTMNFYVTENMKCGVGINVAEIEAMDNDNNMSSFEVGQVSFTTGKGEEAREYSMLVTHIPNAFVGAKERDDSTHQAIMDYALNQKEEHNNTLVAYTGDTNYRKQMAPFSLMSAGGNAGKAYITPPTSSQAGKRIGVGEDSVLKLDSDGIPINRSFFMQTAPLIENDGSFCVSQPNMLNLVRPDYPNSKTDSDHPAMMTYVPLNNRLNPSAYGNACSIACSKTRKHDEIADKNASSEYHDKNGHQPMNTHNSSDNLNSMEVVDNAHNETTSIIINPKQDCSKKRKHDEMENNSTDTGLLPINTHINNEDNSLITYIYGLMKKCKHSLNQLYEMIGNNSNSENQTIDDVTTSDEEKTATMEYTQSKE